MTPKLANDLDELTRLARAEDGDRFWQHARRLSREHDTELADGIELTPTPTPRPVHRHAPAPRREEPRT